MPMSDSGFINQVYELTKESRRELQLQRLKAWDLGKVTGRQCIEDIVMLEDVITLDMKKVNEIRSHGGPTKLNKENPTN